VLRPPLLLGELRLAKHNRDLRGALRRNESRRTWLRGARSFSPHGS
jgi:hypothetical protein